MGPPSCCLFLLNLSRGFDDVEYLVLENHPDQHLTLLLSRIFRFELRQVLAGLLGEALQAFVDVCWPNLNAFRLRDLGHQQTRAHLDLAILLDTTARLGRELLPTPLSARLTQHFLL